MNNILKNIIRYCLVSEVILTIFYLSNPYFLFRASQLKKVNDLNIFDGKQVSPYLPEVLKPIENIHNQNRSVYTVLKENRIKNFFQGNGNCANQCTGLGAYLKTKGKDYLVVHFLPKNGLFNGYGHSILLLISDKNSILIDPIGKSVPTINKKFLNLSSLIKIEPNKLEQVSFFKINNYGIDIKDYYSEKFPKVMGIIPSKEYDKFYNLSNFLLKFYPFEETAITRLFVNGVATILFSNPNLYVDKNGLNELYNFYPYLRYLRILAKIYVLNFWLIFLLYGLRTILKLQRMLKN